MGRVKAWEIKADTGLWVQAQLDASSEYFEAIGELVRRGKLYFSSGAMSHLVRVDKASGEIKRWPWCELSLTPAPANLYATLDLADAEKHFKAAGLTLPDVEGAAGAGQAVKHWGHLEGSFEDLLEDLSQLVNPPSPFGPPIAWSSIADTVPDSMPGGRVYVGRSTEGGETDYYEVAYSIGADGEPVLGTATPVQSGYLPAREAGTGGGLAFREAPFALEGEMVGRRSAVLARFARALKVAHIKEGRVLSTANRRMLAECRERLNEAAEAIADLLERTDPEAKSTQETLTRARADALRLASVILGRGRDVVQSRGEPAKLSDSQLVEAR